MAKSNHSQWEPRNIDKETSNIATLIKKFGLNNYDDFYRYSIENPDEYWKKINDFCQIVWAESYDEYLDASKGNAFPEWFVGGRLNWVDTVLQWAKDPETANQMAIIAEHEDGQIESVTYKQLENLVQHFASGLKKQGLKRGDRVGFLMENGIEANVTFLSLVYAGMIVVPLFTGFGADAIVARLKSCEAKALIATTGFSRRGKFVDTRAALESALEHLPTMELVIWKAHKNGKALNDNDISWKTVVDAEITMPVSEKLDSSTPFMVIYTSGTTGKPKGPVHIHGGFPLKVAHDAAIHFDVKKGDVFCWPADMGWVAGPIVSSCAFLRGATLVTYDGAPDFPDWSRMAQIIERHKVTHYGSSPTLIRGFAANEELATKADMSSLHLMITSGESIDPEHYNWLQKHFGDGNCPIINYTGGTEVSGGLLSSVVIKPISASAFNTASPSIEVDVVNESGESLRGEVGELAVRKPFVGMAHSFWQDDERYLDTYWSAVPGLWIHGDLVCQDDHKDFTLLGRSDDTMKIAGKRLGPAEVEEILLELPEIAEVAAVGVSDPVKGQKVVVFVVPSAQWNCEVASLQEKIKGQVAERMGKPFAPSHVYILGQLPRTRSSKVMRRVIRNVYTGMPLGDLSSLDNPSSIDELKQIVHVIS